MLLAALIILIMTPNSSGNLWQNVIECFLSQLKPATDLETRFTLFMSLMVFMLPGDPAVQLWYWNASLVMGMLSQAGSG